MQTAPRGHRATQIAFDLCTNVAKTGWNRSPARDGERQPLGLAWTVIWVLPQDDDPNFRPMSQLQRTEDASRHDVCTGQLTRQNMARQLPSCCTVAPGLNNGPPTGWYLRQRAVQRLPQTVVGNWNHRISADPPRRRIRKRTTPTTRHPGPVRA